MSISNSPRGLSARVADTLRAEMARSRVSQQELASRLGLTQQKISRRMSGRVAFSLDELEQIASALGLSVQDLVSGAGTRSQAA